MGLSAETGIHEQGIQTTRVVMDVINNCNLACHYCHPNMGGWGGETLSAEQVGGIFQAAEDQSILEVTLTGGEITIHPEFRQIMEATHMLDRTAVSFVTNATRITPEIIREIGESNVDRVCVSVDGPDAKSHNSRRGHNFDTVMDGLDSLQETGKPITVISVVHKQNYQKMIELSEMLASQGLAEQHHMCAASYSGAAKHIFHKFAFEEPEFHTLQAMIDKEYKRFKEKGFHVTFNSYWPAVGQRGENAEPRTMTLIQFNEQVKDIYAIIRPNGDMRLAAASWGRETVGDAVVGNLSEENAGKLLKRVDEIYRSGRVRQLPRDIEAGHKFHVGSHVVGKQSTDILLADKSVRIEHMDLSIPIRPLSKLDLLDNQLTEAQLTAFVCQIASQPERWRLVQHTTGVDLLFDRHTSHTTVLKPEETTNLKMLYEDYIQSTQLC